MDDRSERVLVATKDWRVKAKEAFRSLKRGSMAECAREIGCSQALVNKILSGEIVTSEMVGPISDWLRAKGAEVPRPQAEISSEAQRELLDEARRLDPESFQKLLEFIRAVRRR
jgi:hypothetical protein